MDDDTKKFIHNWSFILLALFSVLIVLWIVAARIPLSTLWIFGEASYGDAWRAAQGVQVGYLYGARDAIPACLLLIIASRKKAKWGTLSTALLVVYTILLAGPGGRYYVLIPTMGAIALYYLERRKSPTVLQLSLLMFVLFYFLVGGLGYFRNPGNEIGEVEYTVSDAWDTTLEGTNLVVSTAASVKIVPRYENYLMGSSYLQLLIQPIPRFLWPDKPSWFGPRLLKEYWQYGAAAPFWVSFYLNFGLVGVLVGCILLGMFFRKIYNSYLYNPGNPLWIVLLSVFIPFMIHGYGRGSNEPGFVIYGAIYVMLPIILMTVLLRWRSRYHKIEVEYIPTGYEAGT
jgi:oligosaccharide repeat unit polymerase